MNRRNHSKQKQRAGQDTELKAVLWKHKAEGLKVRRANAHLFLNKGHSASFVADVLFLDADTVRPLAPRLREVWNGIVGFGGVSRA